MPRRNRLVVPGLPHHVTQKGNLDCDVFEEDGDRRAYLSMLHKYAGRYGLDVWAYCLMTNHVHIVCVPRSEGSLSKTLRDAHTRYATWFNRRRAKSGHLWHNRYYSCVMDESHLWAAVRYVERNPVRAGLVTRAEQYLWSSAAAHCGLNPDPLIQLPFPIQGRIADWGKWLADEDVALSAAVRHGTAGGRPLGGEDFLREIEMRAGLILPPNK